MLYHQRSCAALRTCLDGGWSLGSKDSAARLSVPDESLPLENPRYPSDSPHFSSRLAVVQAEGVPGSLAQRPSARVRPLVPRAFASVLPPSLCLGLLVGLGPDDLLCRIS